MIFHSNFLLILLSILFVKVSTKCSEISTYENGLPLSLSKLANDDYVGTGITTLHDIYLKSINYWSNYSDPKNCIARVVKMGARLMKFSLRPRGCCAHCCLLDKVEDYLTIYLFSKSKNVQRIKMSTKKKARSLSALGVNNQSRTLLLVPGFGDIGYGGIWFDIVPQVILKKREHFNLLVLDYSDLIPTPWYQESIDNLKLVANVITDFLIFYHKTGELRIENIHIVGLSLGAQLAGHVGRQIGKFKKVARITGLDPAFVLYDPNDAREYISKGDAEFVDVIHTTSGLFGDRKATAHTDFFIEYPPGASRPGCDLLKLFDMDLLADFIYICDHIRSVILYFHTLLNPYLLPVCKNITLNSKSSEICGYVGFGASKNTTIGEYHLPTELDWEPFQEPENVE